MEVTALKNFEHNGSRRRGSTFTVPARAASDLERKGLVAVSHQVTDKVADPAQAAGRKLSASPAAPASPLKTARQSRRGATTQTEEE